MKHPLTILFVSIFLLLSPVSPFAQEKPSWSVCFSPHGGCTEAIIGELHGAKSTVLVQAYSFTSAPIAKALLDAHNRRVKVEVLLDKSQAGKKGGYSPATLLFNQGIPVKIDAAHAIAHNKVMVIDGKIVITGSFNFTRAAEEKNAENLLIIHDRRLAELYSKNWQEHERHSETYGGRESSKTLSRRHGPE
jgi:phosphatidylserine/phosphatidylglycerophosphate/cardiolipin synthase-like enzyme